MDVVLQILQALAGMLIWVLLLLAVLATFCVIAGTVVVVLVVRAHMRFKREGR